MFFLKIMLAKNCWIWPNLRQILLAVKKVDEYEYLWHQNLEVWLCAAHKNLAALVAINCINGLLSFFSFFVLYTIRKCVNCQYSMFNKSFDVTIPTKLDKGDEKKKK